MFCAGPKNGSGRLWAIMIRSRTSTAYMCVTPARSGLGIADDGGEAAAGRPEDARQLAGGVFEGDLLGDQRVERRHGGKQAGGGLDAAAMGPARPVACRDVTHLRGDELQPAAV